MIWLVLGLVLLVGLAAWVTWTANRIDRLAARTEGAWQSLDAQLVRRAMALGDLAADGADGAEAIRAAVHRASAAPASGRAAAENELSRIIAGLPHRDEALASACERVRVARTFYNDAVRASIALRGQRLPRLLRLGRTHPVMSYFDIDDDAHPGRR